MSSTTPSENKPIVQYAVVTESTFLGLLWTGVAVSSCFLVFRLYVKLRSFRRLYSDDYLVFAAWIMLLAFAILWQVEVPTLYLQYAVQSGNARFTPGFINKDTELLRSIVPFTILFYSCLWAVKISLLLFFRRLGSSVRGQRIWWWSIFVITVIAWVACIGDINWRCSLGSYYWIYVTSHCNSAESVLFEFHTLVANCVVDLVTDCLILSLPLMIIWRVKIPLRKKSVLIAVFSLTVVVMVVSIVRVAVVNSPTKNPSISWLYLWSSIEMTTSIIVACLVSFRQLFITSRSGNQPGRARQDNAPSALYAFFWDVGLIIKSPFVKSSRTDSSRHSRWHLSPGRGQERPSDSSNRVPFVPLDSIHVSHNIHFTNRDFELENYSASYPMSTREENT